MTFTQTTRLSQALRMAADDVESVAKAPSRNLTFDMRAWLRGTVQPDGTIAACTTCLAGAVMIERFDGMKLLGLRRDSDKTETNEITPAVVGRQLNEVANGATERKLAALDLARNGDYRNAIELGWAEHGGAPDAAIKELSELPRPSLGETDFISRNEIRNAIAELRNEIIPKLEALGC